MEPKPWKVYVHTNKINGKKYVGITSREDPNQRWKNGNGYSENSHFRAAINKYGWDSFEHDIIADCLSENDAKQMEKDLIAKWGTQNRELGYNMTAGGDGTLNCFPSEASRRKHAISSMRENLSEETLRKRSEALRGRKFTDEHKRKIGDANSKPVCMYSKDDTLLRIFDSAHCAEVELGISHSHISQCCHGKRTTTGGYKWSFAQ